MLSHMYTAIVSGKNGNYLTFHEVATICTLPLFPGKMATTWLYMKLPPYVRCHRFQEKWQLLDFQSCVESVALISNQTSDGWIGSASYYIFQVEKLVDFILLYYWQGRFWRVPIAI
jgi:hypothetical protein